MIFALIFTLILIFPNESFIALVVGVIADLLIELIIILNPKGLLFLSILIAGLIFTLMAIHQYKENKLIPIVIKPPKRAQYLMVNYEHYLIDRNVLYFNVKKDEINYIQAWDKNNKLLRDIELCLGYSGVIVDLTKKETGGCYETDRNTKD